MVSALKFLENPNPPKGASSYQLPSRAELYLQLKTMVVPWIVPWVRTQEPIVAPLAIQNHRLYPLVIFTKLGCGLG